MLKTLGCRSVLICPLLRLAPRIPLRVGGLRGYRPSSTAGSNDSWSRRRRVGTPAISSPVPSSEPSLEEVLGTWERNRDSFTSHDFLSQCLYRCLKAASAERLSPSQLMELPRFQSLWRHLCSQVPSMSANTAVMCLYNCAQYDFRDSPSASLLVDVCLQKSSYIPPRAFGILLWSLHKLRLYQDSQPLVVRVVQRFHSELLSGVQFKPQAFANVLWVLATTKTWPSDITQCVMEYVPQRAGDLDFHSLSIVLWAVTTAGLPASDAFLNAAGDRAAALLQRQLPVISVVHCCWAFGSASYYHRLFFPALRDKLCAEPLQSPSFTPRLLSSVAWACARAGYYDAGLLDHIAAASLSRLGQFNSQDLGNLAYCYGYLNHRSDKLLLAISRIMSSQLEMAANELACANVANSCLVHRLYPEALFRELLSKERVAGERYIKCDDALLSELSGNVYYLLSTALLEEGAGKHLHLCLQIHSVVKVERPDLEECVLQPPHDKIIAALVLSESAVHCQRTYSVFHHNICKALLQITGSSQHFTKEALTTFSSFIDAEVILNHEGKALPIPPQWRGWNQPRQLLARAYSAEEEPLLWQAIDKVCSKREVSSLDALLPEEVCLASDWAARMGHPAQPVARKVAIEADGPRHYAANCRHKLGTTVLKHRLLTALGWDVIAVKGC